MFFNFAKIDLEAKYKCAGKYLDVVLYVSNNGRLYSKFCI